jgi:membrane protease YdiL (CAAX protease family)
MEQSQLPVRNEAQERPIPWSSLESWIGVLLLVLLNIGLLLFVRGSSGAQLAQNASIVFAELAYILPVVIILAWKRASWAHLGFGKFNWSTMGIGCGMLVVGYGIIIVHNLILMLLGIDTQGREIFDIFSSIESPIWLFLAAVIVAPLVEEIFFRGFLFQGFRKRYGWLPALLLSSAIFAAAHLEFVVARHHPALPDQRHLHTAGLYHHTVPAIHSFVISRTWFS